MDMRTRSGASRAPMGLVIFLILMLAGCASGPAPIPSKGSIAASADVNPNPEGRPSPIVLRVFELRTADAFRNADFFSLYRDSKKVLGQDLLGQQEFELHPGETRDFKQQLPVGTRFVGVVAAFRDLDRASWRALAAVPAKSKVALQIRLSRLSVSVSAAKQ